ncbi:polysaccharide biosynthesis protein [Novosphingobium sp.]|uniref:polysaccharide biosynthesis protein n=1 Tax=Novosphingobium sp. TaxID=1874826 RepID=UPI0022C8690A|nr:polysaccharide biosynthesis protein [Novosphingobium sp.]MCZ8075263.1 polysaccharide biosynthesis protein [Roseateles sp.]MCZ8085645.1 polysaccharide biosynthesis protein [Paracoccaceae bacterium]MCZ8255803.1 polysaccharide biosynthesis protein [Polaromonas sp.]MCZ8036412.1 polysaccharide biosynthesis protein [Novosphingobium sp.]MCZ8233481.1 polysaccharide biosynthesis protein [Novosphingobium sp.]
MFKDKVLLITGGTGSFGSTVLRRFIGEPFKEIRIFSRDEKKQEEQRLRYRDPRLRYHIGDVRDLRSVSAAVRDVDFIFHAAALKQVPSCEFHPMEAVKTNVIGTDNVLEAAIAAGVSRVVCLSTDKAVYPINAMGMSKALMEKAMVAKSRLALNTRTVITGTRYGNVLASRGSVIPLFVDQIRNGLPLTITDPTMTRFVMTLGEAVDLVLYAFTHGQNGDLFVQKAPAATIDVLARSVLEVMGVPDHPMKVIGTRHGEKLYETLLSREEMAIAEDRGNYYRVPPDNRDLNYAQFVDQGKKDISEAHDFNSHNTDSLDQAGMSAILRKLDYMQAVLGGGMAAEQ